VFTPPAYAGEFSIKEIAMNILKSIPSEVAAIIPAAQLKITKRNLRDFSDVISRLHTTLEKCPNIGDTERMKEHPAIFHYFFFRTDFYICEYNPKNGEMFGYAILNGDLQNSEWGYFTVLDFSKSNFLNIDYHFEEQSIEAALYHLYPKHFRKPPSLI
jgi:hypothetical protein